MVGREAKQVQAPNERYIPKFVITVWKERGRILGEGFHIATGTRLAVKLRGRSWVKESWPPIGSEEEQLFWNEFAAHKAQYLKLKHYRATGVLKGPDARAKRSAATRSC